MFCNVLYLHTVILEGRNQAANVSRRQ